MIQSTTGNHLPLLTVQYFSPCLASPGDLSMKGGHDVAELPAPWEAVCLESLPSLPKITLLLEAAFILAKRQGSGSRRKALKGSLCSYGDTLTMDFPERDMPTSTFNVS